MFSGENVLDCGLCSVSSVENKGFVAPGSVLGGQASLYNKTTIYSVSKKTWI